MKIFFQNRIPSEKIAIFILSIFYLFGIFFHLWEETRMMVVKLTELTLIISNSIVILYVIKINNGGKNFLFWIFATVLITLIVEILGVHTGKIFGSYLYGETMNIKILGVPCIIGINWAILILASFELSRSIVSKIFLSPFLSGVVIVVFDFIMEPIAIKLDYWQWESVNVSFQNYLTWFLMAVFFSYLILLLKVKTNSKILVVYFFLQLLFFLSLKIFLL